MQIEINQKSVYAPLRYESTRPFANQLGKRFILASRQGATQRLSFVRDILFHAVRNEVERYHVEGPGPVQAEMLNIQVFAEYQGHGKIIFDVSKPLATNLLLTDAESIPCSEMIFPAASFYLHFGSDCGLADEGSDIEGAFVNKYSDRINIDLVRTGFGQVDYFSHPTGELMLGVSIDIGSGSKPILQALDDSISATILKNEKVFSDNADLEAKLTEQYGEIVKVPLAAERLNGKRETLRKALSLIVNTMFYLIAEPDDLDDGWGRDTPKDALATLATAEKLGTKKPLKIRFINRAMSRYDVWAVSLQRHCLRVQQTMFLKMEKRSLHMLGVGTFAGRRTVHKWRFAN